MTDSGEYAREDWHVEEGVRCVVAPCCAFTFDAFHTDNNGRTYSCPLCAQIALEAQVSDLRDEVRRLRLALEEVADFACFNENRVGDPCACCEYVTDRVDDTLGGAHIGRERQSP